MRWVCWLVSLMRTKERKTTEHHNLYRGLGATLARYHATAPALASLVRSFHVYSLIENRNNRDF